MASLMGGATVNGARAQADPVPGDAAPPPGPVWVPSSPPATSNTTDGWTLTLSANSERQTQAPPLAPGAPPLRDYLVGGLFNATLRGPKGVTTPTPSGTIEAGYQIQCVGGGMIAAMKPAAVTVKVLEEDFEGVDASVGITDYRVQVDCLSPAKQQVGEPGYDIDFGNLQPLVGSHSAWRILTGK